MRTYSDHEIEHYGDLFVREDIRARTGQTFEQFLASLPIGRGAPLRTVPRNQGGDFLPLLAAQRQVQERLDREAEAIEQQQEDELERLNVANRNGRLVERMHHTAHPRKAPRRR